MKAHPPNFGWLDAARSPKDEGEKEFREIAHLWLIGHDAKVDEVIRSDLAPLPDIQPDTARFLLRDKVNAFLSTHEVTPRVTDTYEDGVVVTLSFVSFLEQTAQLWGEFILMYTGWRQVGKEVQACAHCWKAFMPQRQGAMYCSDSCRVGAHQKRKRERGS